MKSTYLLSFLTLVFFITPTYADTSLAQIEAYLNGFRTLEGDFQQNAPNGASQGRFAIRKPGKIRLDYDSGQVIFSHDGVLYIYDPTSRDVSQINLNQSLAGFLLQDHINLNDATIKNENENTIEVVLQNPGSDDIGELTLVFQKKPLKLIQWSIVDAQNQTTDVHLNNLQKNTGIQIVTDPNTIMGN